MLNTEFQDTGLVVPVKNILKVLWAWQPTWSYDRDIQN